MYFQLKNIQSFKVLEYYGYKYKNFNETTQKWEQSDTYIQGYKKRYTVKAQADGQEGNLELSQFQIKDMLEATLDKGTASLVGRNFTVKTNGKSGKEIRYYINLDRNTQQPVVSQNDWKQNIPQSIQQPPAQDDFPPIEDFPSF